MRPLVASVIARLRTDPLVGAIFDKSLEGKFRVSVVATGLRPEPQILS